jgi:hypothetical protein
MPGAGRPNRNNFARIGTRGANRPSSGRSGVLELIAEHLCFGRRQAEQMGEERLTLPEGNSTKSFK